jgi:hypothetical protein
MAFITSGTGQRIRSAHRVDQGFYAMIAMKMSA